MRLKPKRKGQRRRTAYTSPKLFFVADKLQSQLWTLLFQWMSLSTNIHFVFFLIKYVTSLLMMRDDEVADDSEYKTVKVQSLYPLILRNTFFLLQERKTTSTRTHPMALAM